MTSKNHNSPRDETPRERRPGPQQTRFAEWLDWLPWEKILIWGLFLLAVYTLRHFFFLIFMTFILSYIMRSVVVRIARLFSRRERVWLERALTLICFAALLFGLYEGGKYIGPHLVDQGEALVARVRHIEPRTEFESFTAKTVGAWEFRRRYGGRNDPRYQAEFETYLEEKSPSRAYEEFPELEERLEKQFLERKESQLRRTVKSSAASDKAFEEWFLQEKVPEIFQAKEQELIENWEEQYRSSYNVGTLELSLEEFQKDPEYEEKRNALIARGILRQELSDPEGRKQLRQEWEDLVVATGLDAFTGTEEHEKEFREFYESLRENPAVSPVPPSPYPYEKYVALEEAYPRGEEAFLAELEESPPQGATSNEEVAHILFERQKQRELAKEVIGSGTVQGIVAFLAPYGEAALQKLTGWIRAALGYNFWLLVQLALAFLLSFFITIDMARIKSGILRLKESRISDFYDEIAPGLYNFGRLIGRAFQAQGVIAFFNTVLTFLAIKFIGIQNEIFLCAIVFICSFIPVLGVVLSSVPISIMAIVQPDGNLIKALEIIGAILVIHFIETSVLNPKILGDMLHLHPVLVLAVLAIGEHFAGVWGLLLGVPVAVYIIRCVILDEEIPGLIEQRPLGRGIEAGEGARARRREAPPREAPEEGEARERPEPVAAGSRKEEE